MYPPPKFPSSKHPQFRCVERRRNERRFKEGVLGGGLADVSGLASSASQAVWCCLARQLGHKSRGVGCGARASVVQLQA